MKVINVIVRIVFALLAIFSLRELYQMTHGNDEVNFIIHTALNFLLYMAIFCYSIRFAVNGFNLHTEKYIQISWKFKKRHNKVKQN